MPTCDCGGDLALVQPNAIFMFNELYRCEECSAVTRLDDATAEDASS